MARLKGKGKKRPKTKKEGEPKEESDAPAVKIVKVSDDPPVRRPEWTNKTRVLLLSSRGVGFRLRHLMEDLRTMLPHSKGDVKLERKEKIFELNEIAETKNCSKVVYFEMKKGKDMYVWLANAPHGPSFKCLVENVHTLAEMKLTGNSLKGSRPLVSFAEEFNSAPHYKVMQELLQQIFNTPQSHPRSQPFIDHVLSFSIADHRVWCRNYQVLDETSGALCEIGPRFTLNPIVMLSGSFGGPVLWQNAEFVSPNQHRSLLKQQVTQKFRQRLDQQEDRIAKEALTKDTYRLDSTQSLFASG